MTRPTQANRLGREFNHMRRLTMTIKVLGIDLGKRYLHIHGVDKNGVLATLKTLKRKELLLFLGNLEAVFDRYGGL